jgi:hypothetical protein
VAGRKAGGRTPPLCLLAHREALSSPAEYWTTYAG